MPKEKIFSPVQVASGLSFVAQNLNNEHIQRKQKNGQALVDLSIKELRGVAREERRERSPNHVNWMPERCQSKIQSFGEHLMSTWKGMKMTVK